MCRDMEQLLHFLVSHHVVLGEFRCEHCGLNLVSVVLCVCRFSAVGFSPLPEISGISIVTYVSELFVDGKCIIHSLVCHTFVGGAIYFFMLLGPSSGYQPRPQAGG